MQEIEHENIIKLTKDITFQILSFVPVDIGLVLDSTDEHEIACRICLDRGFHQCKLSHVDIVEIPFTYIDEFVNDTLKGSRELHHTRKECIFMVDSIKVQLQKCEEEKLTLLDTCLELCNELTAITNRMKEYDTSSVAQIDLRYRFKLVEKKEEDMYRAYLAKEEEKEMIQSAYDYAMQEYAMMEKREEYLMDQAWRNEWAVLKYEMHCVVQP